MPTISQLIRQPRCKVKRRGDCPALQRCPQKKGVCLRVYTTTPKKPNSAERKVARVRLSNNEEVTVYIPGETSSHLGEHSAVLVRGGGPHDLPGVNYSVIRGVGDAKFVPNQRRGRSRYGTPKPKRQ